MSNERTIDTHTHILTQETAELLTKAGVKVTITPDDSESAALDVAGVVYRPFPTGGFDIPRRLKDMDATGVDVHVLSATPQTYLYNQEPALGATLAAIQNDQIAKHISAHPGRFMGIATLPLQDPKRAADELRRAMTKLGLKGSMFASNIMGKNLDDPSFEPVWATAEELGAFMFVHPNNVAGADRLKSYYLQNLIGNPLDTTIAAACLYFGGVLDRHPKLTVMLAHGGGFTPYQAARWEHGWAVRPEPKKNISRQPQEIAKRFYYDTILHSAPVLEFMIGHVGADRVMLGSDYPYDMAMMDCVKHVRGLKISDADKATILVNTRGKAVVGKTMNVQAAKAARIPTAAVTGLIVDAMMKAGVSRDDAVKIAELMLEADLIGADAHGVFRLMQYVQRLKLGSTNPRPNIVVKRSAPATALVDGDNGMGHLVVARAAETAIELARECGVAWVGCRMSGHAGAAGVYAALPLKADMVGIYSAVANANHMPLAGGAEPLLGTNPVAIAIPAGKEPPVVLDIATSDRFLRHDQESSPAEQAAAGRLDDRSENRRGDHRSAQERGSVAAADGRLQGRGSGAGTRSTGRHAQWCAIWSRLCRFQRRAGQGYQHRAIRAGARSEPFPADRSIQGRGRPAYPRAAQHKTASRSVGSAARRATRAAPRRSSAQWITARAGIADAAR